MKDMNWIDINDKWPEHDKTVLVKCNTLDGKLGYAVAVFINSKNMNEFLENAGYSNECVDIKIIPYYFASQERKRYTLDGVTHWMELVD